MTIQFGLESVKLPVIERLLNRILSTVCLADAPEMMIARVSISAVLIPVAFGIAIPVSLKV